MPSFHPAKITQDTLTQIATGNWATPMYSSGCIATWNGVIFVCYYYQETAVSTGSIRLAISADYGATWTIKDVPNSDVDTLSGQMWVDSNGVVHIVFYHFNDYGYYITYDYPNDQWSARERVSLDNEPCGGYTVQDCYDIVICGDRNDTVHILIRQGTTTAFEALIHKSKPSGGSWSDPVIINDPVNEFVTSYSMVRADSQNRLHVSYFCQSPVAGSYRVWYILYDGSWHPTVQISLERPEDDWNYHDIDVDPDGYPHIVFHDFDAEDVIHLYQDADGWHSEIITTSNMDNHSLVINPDGIIHIFSLFSPDLYHFQKRPGGSWTSEVIHSGVSFNGYGGSMPRVGIPGSAWYGVFEKSLQKGLFLSKRDVQGSSYIRERREMARRS